MSFRPGQNLTFARSITASTVVARQPTGFAGGGANARISNLSTTLWVAVQFYNYAQAAADPTLTFPADGAPPTGQPVTVIGPNQTVYVEGVGNADSFAAIGSAAGPSIILVQKGDGATS